MRFRVSTAIGVDLPALERSCKSYVRTAEKFNAAATPLETVRRGQAVGAGPRPAPSPARGCGVTFDPPAAGPADARSAAEFRAAHTGRQPDFVTSEIKSHFKDAPFSA